MQPFLLGSCSFGLPPVLWWLSPGEGWYAIIWCGGKNCKKGATVGYYLATSPWWWEKVIVYYYNYYYYYYTITSITIQKKIILCRLKHEMTWNVIQSHLLACYTTAQPRGCWCHATISPAGLSHHSSAKWLLMPCYNLTCWPVTPQLSWMAADAMLGTEAISKIFRL